ncbi:conjugal transfer protein [Streptomyces sp. SS8]
MNALSGGQKAVLGIAGALMLATAGIGAYGTYTNIKAEFGNGATAAGMVAAGEGATLVLALVMVGVTLLGQGSPAPVRIGLWLAPVVASIVGLAVADNGTEAVIYGVSPMGMCVAAEGLGFLARRIVVYRTGTDAEAQRRNAEAVQQLAYHRAVADGHPDEKVRRKAEKAAWKLARKVGVGDLELGARLVAVQRERLTGGADAALVGMFGAAVARPEVTGEVTTEAPEVTISRADTELPEPVMPPVAELPAVPLLWDDMARPEAAAQVTASVPAEAPREVVTERVVLTPADLRREARKLHREAVRSTRRPVTIKALQDALSLSRREATELRREVLGEERS